MKMIEFLKLYSFNFVVRRKSKFKASKITKHELRTSAFEPINTEQSKLRSQLIERVGNAFYVSGIALLQLKEERLYRSTHFSFDEFCTKALASRRQDIFGYSSDYAYLKMAAAKVYQNLIDNLPPSLDKPTIGRQPILPTRQRQLRPIVKAKLDPDAQVDVWQMAISLAEDKVPSNSIVTEAVNLYLAEDDTQLNPFVEGEICQIIVRGNNKLNGKRGNWCIIEEVNDNNCIVNTWNDQLEVPIKKIAHPLHNQSSLNENLQPLTS